MFDWRISVASLALAGIGGALGLDARPLAAPPVAAARSSAVVPGADGAEPSQLLIHAARSGNGLFYANLDFNGKVIRFLIDTGATHMVLTAADARTIGLAPGGGTAGSLETVAGQRSARWAHLGSANVAGEPVGEVDAIVIADGMQTSLLGQNVLTRLGKLTIDGDSLTINRR
jgi:aspartyl protease family protein